MSENRYDVIVLGVGGMGSVPYTAPFNISGMPAVSIPVGTSTEGLPVGLQVVGPHFSEARVLQAAHAFQRVTNWHTRVPRGYA